MSDTDAWEGEKEISDGELIQFLRDRSPLDLDGVWHPQTNALAAKWGASKLDLNRWWCRTPIGWVCPACKRAKPQIARVNKHGKLMCHLVEHHDHMDTLIQNLLNEYASTLSNFLATNGSEAFAKRCGAAMSGFDPIVICEDCNNLDSVAKRVVGAHTAFSFTARDIGQFAIKMENRSHELDHAKLSDVWRVRGIQLQRRLELGKMLSKLAATNEYWYEAADFRDRPQTVTRHAELSLVCIPREWNVSLSRFEAVSASQVSCSPNRSGWRRNKRLRADAPPNQQELAWLMAGSHQGHFGRVADNWVCPWCRRTKFETIRPSKQFPWSFSIGECWMEDRTTRGRLKIVVCRDCYDTRIQLAKEADIEIQLVDPLDVISIIVPKPHSQHLLKSDHEIDAIIERMAKRAAY